MFKFVEQTDDDDAVARQLLFTESELSESGKSAIDGVGGAAADGGANCDLLDLSSVSAFLLSPSAAEQPPGGAAAAAASSDRDRAAEEAAAAPAAMPSQWWQAAVPIVAVIGGECVYLCVLYVLYRRHFERILCSQLVTYLFTAPLRVTPGPSYCIRIRTRTRKYIFDNDTRRRLLRHAH